MSEHFSLQDFISAQLRDESAQWSMGTFGAIAEFSRDTGEPVRISGDGGRSEAVTDKGGIRLTCPADARAIAYETLSRTPDHWTMTVALCLPLEDCAMSRRSVLTELGPDSEALRPGDRQAVLFDLGLGALQVDVAIRTSDAALLDVLRACAGRSVLDPHNPAMARIVAAGPHRVFLTRLGRAEVYQPIPAPDGKSPDGPHTHLLPKLLRSGRTHAATAPIPQDWVPCASLHPLHPARDAMGRPKSFDRAQHARTQAMLDDFGDAHLAGIKRHVLELVAAGREPGAFDPPADRFGRAALRIALRQAKALGADTAALARWRDAYENVVADADEGEMPEVQSSH